MESELLARFEALGVDVDEYEDEIRWHAGGCHCDVDYQCFNIECRERNEELARPYRR